MTQQTRIMYVQPLSGERIACEVVDEVDGMLILWDGELQWTVKREHVNGDTVKAAFVFLAEN